MGLFDFLTSAQKSNEELYRLAEIHDPFIRKRLSQPRNRVEAEAKMLAPQWLKISHDCENLVNNTVNPEVFFSRFELLESVYACMALIQSYVKFSGTQPRDGLKKIQDARTPATKAFIERSYAKMMEQADAMRTEKGRKNKIEKYFSAVEPHLSDDDAMAYFQKLKAEHF